MNKLILVIKSNTLKYLLLVFLTTISIIDLKYLNNVISRSLLVATASTLSIYLYRRIK